MVKVKNTARKVPMLPRALVPHRCVVCHLTFNRRQSLSRHYKKQHRLPREWREFGNPEPAALAVLQNVSAVLPVSTPQETSTEPSTSMAAWADEAVTAALAVLPAPEGVDVGPDEDDLPSTLDLESDEESDGAEAAVRGVSTAVPPRLAPRKDLCGVAVDYVVSGWGEPTAVATPELFSMTKELPGRSVASLASVIGQRLRVPSPERSQLRRRLSAMAYSYRQAQQEVRNLLPVGPCSEEDLLEACRSIVAWAAADTMPAPALASEANCCKL